MLTDDLAIRLVLEDYSDAEALEWEFIFEEDTPGYKRNRGNRQVWRNGDQYWEISYLTSYDDGMDEDSVTFKKVERKVKTVIVYE